MNPLIPPPVVAAIIGALMWVVNRSLPWGGFTFEFREPAALLLLATGLLLMLAAAGQFFAAKTTINPMRPANASKLITTGVFAMSRNPIYLADLLILAAVAVWLSNVINAALPALFVCYLNRFQIAPEEHALSERFGEAYAAYRARVRRWV